MSPEQLKAMLLGEWRFTGRPKQQPPDGSWMYWWINAGRGFGKTLSGAQWAKQKALGQRTRGAVVAPTLGDVRRTCFEGETGLLSVLSPDMLLGGSRATAWNKSSLELTLANGTIVTGFSSEEPDRLRGPQHDWAWGEEVSSWKDADKHPDDQDTTWWNLRAGLRLGTQPQACLTSTPKVNRLTRRLAEMAERGKLVMVRGSSYENRVNLSESWWQSVVAPVEGTRTGRQEILAEILTDVEGALWTAALIDSCRVEPQERESMERIVVALDPNVTSGETADAAGIVVAGRRRDPDGKMRAYVLEDSTTTSGGPTAWRTAAVEAYYRWEADLIVAEINNGGELVSMVIQALDPNVPVEVVTASRGKRTRAEPVSILYEKGWETEGHFKHDPSVYHAGSFVKLEEEMTTWAGDSNSPNRMDALVWAITELMLGDSGPIEMRTYVPEGRIDDSAHSGLAGGTLSGLDRFGL